MIKMYPFNYPFFKVEPDRFISLPILLADMSLSQIYLHQHIYRRYATNMNIFGTHLHHGSSQI